MMRLLSMIAAFSMSLGLTVAKDDPKPDSDKPPEGWKEYSPKDKTYSVFIPEKTKAPLTEKSETNVVDKQKVKFNNMYCESKTAAYQTSECILPASIPAKARETIISNGNDLTLKGFGKVTEKSDIKVGSASGKEYRLVDSNGLVTRVRMFTSGTHSLMVRVTGKKDVVDGDEGKVFLESAKFTSAKGGGTAGAVGAKPKILGTPFGDPEFKDMAPDEGLLIGFEVGLVKSGKQNLIRAIKPIFLTGDKEMTGEQRGTKLGNVVTLKAKEGYAVGAISVKGGFDGMSVTFMKIKDDGKLDPKDSYESDYVGIDEKKSNPVKQGGDGTPVIGIVGKTNDKDLTGMGLLFKGQENYEPKPKK
jgi:hypothetical protein